MPMVKCPSIYVGKSGAWSTCIKPKGHPADHESAAGEKWSSS